MKAAGPECTLRIEVPRGGFVKRDATGRAVLRSPLPCPFAYGSVPGQPAADGDEVDAVLLGAHPQAGTLCTARLVGVVHFIDNGAPDDKYIFWAGAGPGPSAAQRLLVGAFFALYATVKTARAYTGGPRGPTRAGPTVWGAIPWPPPHPSTAP